MTEKQVFKTTWGGRPLEVEIGQLFFLFLFTLAFAFFTFNA